MSTAQSLLQEALNLPAEEREDLALRLMESLSGAPDADVEAAWVDEVNRRVGVLRQGNAQTHLAADVLREARERSSK